MSKCRVSFEATPICFVYLMPCQNRQSTSGSTSIPLNTLRNYKADSLPLFIARVIFIVRLHELFPSIKLESSTEVRKTCHAL